MPRSNSVRCSLTLALLAPALHSPSRCADGSVSLGGSGLKVSRQEPCSMLTQFQLAHSRQCPCRLGIGTLQWGDPGQGYGQRFDEASSTLRTCAGLALSG